jgi:putative transposase
MDEFESLSHSKWECKYHVVFIPKCRRKVLYGNLRKHLGELFRKLAEQKECRILEGHLLADHVHMMISIPPKYAVSQVVGFIKGKSAIHLARVYGERKQNDTGQNFWARGYFVSTVGQGLRTFQVLRPFAVESGTVAPWFGQIGLGIQLRSAALTLGELLEQGYLSELP